MIILLMLQSTSIGSPGEYGSGKLKPQLFMQLTADGGGRGSLAPAQDVAQAGQFNIYFAGNRTYQDMNPGLFRDIESPPRTVFSVKKCCYLEAHTPHVFLQLGHLVLVCIGGRSCKNSLDSAVPHATRCSIQITDDV